MKIRNTFYYEATSGTGGPAPSLADIGVNGEVIGPALGTNDDGIQSGDGTPKPPVLGNDTPIEGVNTDGSIQNGYEKNADGSVTKVPEQVEGVNEDGSLQDGYVKDAGGKVVKDPEYKPAEEGDTNFFETVEKITGVKVEVEYPEGVEPDTPEGIALRDQKLMEMGATSFEEYLQKNDPRSYAFLLHRAAGKSEEEFFGTKGGYTLPTKESLETDADAQAAVYKYELMTLKGNNEDEADALVTIAVKNNTLSTKSTASYGTIQAAQDKQLADLQAQTKQLEEQERTANTTIISAVDKAISSELSFMVPEKDRPAFKQYVVDNLRYQDGKHFVVQEISKESLKNQVEALLFQYKKGDLSNIVRKQAATQASQRLTLKSNKTATTKKEGEGLGRSRSGSLALSEIIKME